MDVPTTEETALRLSAARESVEQLGRALQEFGEAAAEIVTRSTDAFVAALRPYMRSLRRAIRTAHRQAGYPYGRRKRHRKRWLREHEWPIT